MKTDELLRKMAEEAHAEMPMLSVGAWEKGVSEWARMFVRHLGITRKTAHHVRPPRKHNGTVARARKDSSDALTALLDLAEDD